MYDQTQELPIMVIVCNIMLCGCHKVMVGGERRLKEGRSERNMLLNVMVTLERGNHGVLIILRVCFRR